MVTGSLMRKHNLFYVSLNLYPNKKRERKWIPTGLPERKNKRKAEEILKLLLPVFQKDGSLAPRFAVASNAYQKIVDEVRLQNGGPLPEITLKRIKRMLGNKLEKRDIEQQKAIVIEDQIAAFPVTESQGIGKMLFCDYMVLWLEQVSSTIERTTYGNYKFHIHGRIYQYFKEKAITVEILSSSHIAAFYQKLANKERLSQNTIKHFHALIRKALQQLYEEHTIPSNPADLVVNKPKQTGYQANYYNEEQINEYLKIVRRTKMELPVLLASFYGFRRSEAIGLKRGAIDTVTNQLTVRHTVTVANIDHRTEVIKKDRAKNRPSLRSMPLVDSLKLAIYEADERHKHFKQKLGSFYSTVDRDYLCLDDTGYILHPNYVTAKHKVLLEEHNMPHIRYHDLRHSCATLLLSKGVPLEKIKEWMGHADIKSTERYAHMQVSTAKEEMAEIIGNSLKLHKNSDHSIS